MVIYFLALLGGLLLLIVGARFLVDGAAALAGRLGVHPAAIGLTVVAFGTSTPELLVNLSAAIGGEAPIAFGNVVGSNIFNTAIILGISALIAPLTIYKRTTRIEVPLSLLAVAAVAVAAADHYLGEGPSLIERGEGALLLGFFFVFIGYTLSLLGEEAATDEPAGPGWSVPVSILAAILGMGMLFGGGRFTVSGAVGIAELLNVSKRVIALTIVSGGTSLPELVTSVVAARRGQNDLAVSNVVGSNLFNVFFILAVSTIIRPIPVESGGIVDLGVLLSVSLLLFLFIFTGSGRRIERWEGALLLLSYVGYLVYLL